MPHSQTTHSSKKKRTRSLFKQLAAEVQAATGPGNRYRDSSLFRRVGKEMERHFRVPHIDPHKIDAVGLSPDQLLLLRIMLEPPSKNFEKFEEAAKHRFSLFNTEREATHTTLAAGELRDVRDDLLWHENDDLSDKKDLLSRRRTQDRITRIAADALTLQQLGTMNPDALQAMLFQYLSVPAQEKIEKAIEEIPRPFGATPNDRKDLLIPALRAVQSLPNLAKSTAAERDYAALDALPPLHEVVGLIATPRLPPEAPPPWKRKDPEKMPVLIEHAAKSLDGADMYESKSITSWELFRELLRHAPDPVKLLGDKELFGGESEKMVHQLFSLTEEPVNYFSGHPEKADIFVKKIKVPAPLRAKAARCLLGIPFQPQKHPLPQILDYVRQHGECDAYTALDIARLIERKSTLTRVTGLTQQHKHFIQSLSKSSAPLKAAVVEKVGKSLGCKSEEELLLWRQLAAGTDMDPGHHQDQLNECFSHKVDLASRRIAPEEKKPAKRREVLQAFFELLTKAYGFSYAEDLADCIVQKQHMGKHVARELSDALKKVYKGASHEREDQTAEEITSPVKGITLPEHYAKMVAAFAFPADVSLQKQCVDFLSSQEYEKAAAAAKKTKPAGPKIHEHRRPGPRTFIPTH